MSDAANLLERTPGGIAVVTLQNAGEATLARGLATLGQVFAPGELPPGGTLYAQIGSNQYAVQVDVKTTWPDGSAKMVVLTMERPPLDAGAEKEIVLVAGSPLASGSLDLAHGLDGHQFSVTLTPTDGSAAFQVDVLQALRDALAHGTASFWQSGPLASQARVEVLVPDSSQRLVFDVTLFRDGSFAVDAQFNNDRAMEPVGGHASYALRVVMDGNSVAEETVSQSQYQNWHREFSSTEVNGGQGLGDPSAGWLNIVQDVGKLEQLGVVPQYDLTLDVPEGTLAWLGGMTDQPGWGDPLSTNNVTQAMGSTGGRGDIGYTTQGNATWLLSGDARAAAYALGQAEAAGGIPWNFYDSANGTWLNTDNYTKLWTDPRGGDGSPGDPNATGLTQQVPWDTGWVTDTAHQPNLSFVPYVMTGERWILDNLQAQASWNVIGLWPVMRDGSDIIVQNQQVRGAAWAMREIEDAAWASPDGSAEKAYFRAVADDNWAWLVAHIPEWTAQQGEAHGWVPGVYGTAGWIPPWQQDFFASTAILAASRGSTDALTFLKWEMNFLLGRFEHAADGFAFNDGAAYLIAINDPTTGRIYQSWAEIGAMTAAGGSSNGTGWSHSDGYYGQLALSTLAGIYFLTGDTEALDLYRQLVDANPLWTSASDFAGGASYAVTIPGLYGWGNGDDVVNRDTPVVDGRTFDLGSGADVFHLADGGNTVTVSNAETIIGGTGADTVTIARMDGTITVDLGRGYDKLALPDGGWHTLTVSNVERIIGGTGHDQVTLGTAMRGGLVDLGGDNDELTLSSAGPNTLTVRNIEYILGGSADDDVTIRGTIAAGTYVDLGDGKDRLILPANGANSVAIANVETVVGGADADTVILAGYTPAAVHLANVETVVGNWLDDTVTFDTTVWNGSVDLRDGYDRLTLSDQGPNRVTVAGTEVITGGAQDDEVRLASFVWNAQIDLKGGSDKLILNDSSANLVSVANVETIVGGAGNDTVSFSAPAVDVFVNLGDGYDVVQLSSAGPNRITLSGVEQIVGGTRNDSITILSPAGLSGGKDGPSPIVAPVSFSVQSIERIKGSAADETVTFTNQASGSVVNLAGGQDTLVLCSWTDNSVSVKGVETVFGGGASDTVTVLNPGQRGVVTLDLGGGGDKAILATDTGTGVKVNLANVETVIGGADGETVRYTTLAYNALADLGGGNDRIELGAFNNIINVANVETVVGNTGQDRITVTGGPGALLNGGAGSDTLSGGAAADTLQGGADFDVLTGGAGADHFLFTAVADSSAGVPDLITDFNLDQDKLAFQGLLQGGFAYLGTGSFTGGGHTEARYAAGTQVLQVDVNGDGAGDMAIQLNGVAMASLTAQHFIWA